MQITIEELLDYIQCPMLHQFRYIWKEDATLTGLHRGYPKLNQYSLEESFDREIHKIGYHIFNYVQDGRYPSQYILRQKWGSLWCKDKTLQDVLFEPTTLDTMTPPKRLEKEGVKVIEQMHARFKEDPGVPILVGKRMDVKVGKHILTVTIDLVREVVIDGKPLIEIMDFKTGMKTKSRMDIRPLNLHIDHDLSMTAISLGFRQLTGEIEDHLTYYDMNNDSMYHTERDEYDYLALERVLDHVEKAMEHEIVYPVMNDRCFECPYQFQCKKLDWYERGVYKE